MQAQIEVAPNAIVKTSATQKGAIASTQKSLMKMMVRMVKIMVAIVPRISFECIV
jgi:hypothetical protein